jgi:hypothetical protein
VRGEVPGLTNFTITLLDTEATIYSDDSLRLIPPALSEIDENVLQGIFESDKKTFRIMSGLNASLAEKLFLPPNQELPPCLARQPLLMTLRHQDESLTESVTATSGETNMRSKSP